MIEDIVFVTDSFIMEFTAIDNGSIKSFSLDGESYDFIDDNVSKETSHIYVN